MLKCVVSGNSLYTTTYTGKILVADIRQGLEPRQTIQMPRGNAINCLKSRSDSDYLYAVSTQAGNLYCVDKRQMKVVKRCTNFKHCTSIDFDADSLVASWKDGEVKYLNPTTLKVEYIWNCPVWSSIACGNSLIHAIYITSLVNPLKLSNGAFIYGNYYELLIFTPGRSPRLLGKLPTKEMIISVICY